jgi:hypothetical protein
MFWGKICLPVYKTVGLLEKHLSGRTASERSSEFRCRTFLSKDAKKARSLTPTASRPLLYWKIREEKPLGRELHEALHLFVSPNRNRSVYQGSQCQYQILKGVSCQPSLQLIAKF